MKKKMIAVLVLALVVGTVSVFALGIGAQGGYTVNGDSSGALSIKPDGSKFLFAVNGNVGYNTWVEGTADLWAANKNLAGPVNYFYGVGAAAGVKIWGNGGLSATAGVRLLAGLNTYLLDDFLELYLQAAWQPGIQLNIGWGDLIDPIIDAVPINLGFRFWL